LKEQNGQVEGEKKRFHYNVDDNDCKKGNVLQFNEVKKFVGDIGVSFSEGSKKQNFDRNSKLENERRQKI